MRVLGIEFGGAAGNVTVSRFGKVIVFDNIQTHWTEDDPQTEVARAVWNIIEHHDPCEAELQRVVKALACLWGL